MKSLLIATDFSETATNAAHYAVKLSTYLNIEALVIYHSYDNEGAIVSELPMPDTQDILLQHERCLQELEQLKENLQKTAPAQLSIQLVTNDKSLLLGIEQLAIQYQSQLLVIGTTGKGYLEEILVGSNALYLARESALPLLLVPKAVDFHPPKKAILATDLKHVEKTIPVNRLRHFIKLLNLQLLVLNVSTTDDQLVADIIPEQYKLHALLEEIHPEYHYITHRDIGEAITSFCAENQADLLIAIPKSRNFIDNFFHKSVTKKLAFRSKIPLLLLHPH